MKHLKKIIEFTTENQSNAAMAAMNYHQPMIKVGEDDTYAYYVGNDIKGHFYNIVPKDSEIPSAGYFSKSWILNVKHGNYEFFSEENLKNFPEINEL